MASRPLIPRRYPRLLLHGPVDVPGLPVRRPWWMLAARYTALRLSRLHRAPVPSSASAAPAVVPEPVHRAPLTRRPTPVPGLAAAVRARAHPVRTVRRVPLSTVDTVRSLTPAPLTAHRAVPEPVHAGRVDGLPVLGGAPVGVPDGGFDASAAVTLPPAPPSPVAPVPAPATRMRPAVTAPGLVRDRTGPGPHTGAAYRTGRPGARPGSLVAQRSAAPGAGPGRGAGPAHATGPGQGADLGKRADAPVLSPEARWRAAVRSRPLESPRTFPSALRPLVESLTGGAQRATYTTGPATRHALASAGALGATTGSVVHLPTAPPAGAAASQRSAAGPGPLLGVIAHELAHARQPVSRPRFLLGVPHGAADAEERAAQAVGQRVQAAGDTVAGLGAGIVGDLPVGGLGRMIPGAGQVREEVEGAVRQTVAGHLPQLPGLPDIHVPQGLVPQSLEQAGGAVTHAAAALTDAASTGRAGSALGGVLGGVLGGLDIDHLAEVLEQRVLRQIERRGGRYSGMF